MPRDPSPTPDSSLHELALTAEAALEKLATKLAAAGVDENAVTSVNQMADVTRKIVHILGKGQEQTGVDEPPAPDEPQTLDSATAGLHSDMQASAAQPAPAPA